MSDKISYILEVLDGYSKNTRKLKKELGTLESSLSSLEKKLSSTLVKFTKFEKLNFASTASQFEKMAKSMDKVSVATARAKKASSGFVLVGSGSQITAVSTAEIRRQRSLKNAVVPFSNPFVMMGGGSGGGSYNPRGYKPNFNIPIDSTYRTNAAGTAVVPYSRGGAVMAFGQRPMIDVTGTSKTIEQESSYSWQSEQRYNSRQRYNPRQNESSRRDGFFTGAALGGFAGRLGLVGGGIIAANEVRNIHDVTVSMDSLRASLSALIPNVKGMENATVSGEEQWLRGVAGKYGVRFQDIAPNYMRILGSGSADASLSKGLIENISGYGRLVGMKPEAFNDTMVAFQQMLDLKKIQGQEVRQLQQMVGGKSMLIEAFRRTAVKNNIKDVTKDNAAAKFMEYMQKGLLTSQPILRELVQLIQEMFGEKMLQKAKTLAAEEARLYDARHKLATTIGDLTYTTQIAVVKDITKIFETVNSSILKISDSFEILDDAMKDSKLYQIVKGGAKGLGTVLTEGVGELVKAPFATIGTAAGVLTGYATGDFAGANEMSREWMNYYFGDPQKQTINPMLSGDPQKIEITIKSDNNIKVQDVKSNRPSTVRAGQK